MAKKRNRRTYDELFLEKLKQLSGNEQKLIANSLVREGLKWSQDRYNRIKKQLVTEKRIISGRGHGGRVGLVDANDVSPLSVFISYSHIDESHKENIAKHLLPLQRLKLITEWHDRKLKAGDDWGEVISAKLESSDIILLLVSIDFINSKYCYDEEMDKALELHDSKKAVVIPIIVRNCLWQHTPFAKLQALPRDGKAITSWEDIDDAYTKVAEGVRLVAESILENK